VRLYLGALETYDAGDGTILLEDGEDLREIGFVHGDPVWVWIRRTMTFHYTDGYRETHEIVGMGTSNPILKNPEVNKVWVTEDELWPIIYTELGRFLARIMDREMLE
jgi:hypothetical protein